MKSWVIVAVAVAVAAAISAKPLSRLRKPAKNDKLKMCLSLAIVLAASVVAWSRPRKSSMSGGAKPSRPLNMTGGARPSRPLNMHGGAQCTVRAPQAGAGYRPYVVPEDLSVGGGVVEDAVAIVPEIPAVAPTYAVPAGVPDPPSPTDVVVGGTLRLVGDF